MFGDRIKEIRKDFNLTQEQFGKKIGLTKSSLSMIEKGQRGLSKSVIKNIINEFCVNEEWLLNGIGEKYDVEKQKEKEILENEYLITSFLLNENIKMLTQLMKTLDEDENTEIASCFQFLTNILTNQSINRANSFKFYETIASLLSEIYRYIELCNSFATQSNNMFRATFDKFLLSFKIDLLNLARLNNIPIDSLLNDIKINTSKDTEIIAPTDNILIQEIIDILTKLPSSELNEIKNYANYRLQNYNKMNKGGRSSTSTHGEEAATIDNATA